MRCEGNCLQPSASQSPADIDTTGVVGRYIAVVWSKLRMTCRPPTAASVTQESAASAQRPIFSLWIEPKTKAKAATIAVPKASPPTTSLIQWAPR